jgi:hypothetical protein
MGKRAPLVCQHLENISRNGLEKYQDVIRAYVRHRHGVYALYKRNKLYYVGLAKDLRWRLKAHLNDRHGELWDRFSVYLTIGDEHLKELESLILRIVKPKGNKVKGKFAKSQDLRRKFASAVRLQYRRELAQLLGREILVVERNGGTRSKSTGRVPILSEYITTPTRLRAVHRGKSFRAHVRRDGSIRFAGTNYNSPSAAGSAAVGRACDGWHFWKFERAPGDWIKLNELRK